MKTYWGTVFAISILIFSCTSKDDSKNTSLSNNTSIDAIYQDIDNDSLHDAYKAAKRVDNDTLKNELFLDISYEAFQKEDSLLFLDSNKKARKLSVSLKDSLGMTETYWVLGKYYYNHDIEDSAYYYSNKAQKLYEDLGDQLNSGRMLLNMAIMQKNMKDYTGSEVTTTNAIALLSSLDDYISLYLAYNNLGIIFNEVGEYEKALYYYESALENIEKSDRIENLPSLYNNIGVVYNNKKEYNEAVSYFKKGLNSSDNLKESNPKTYAMLLDNQAYAQFHLKNSPEVYKQFKKALEIRKELNISYGISVSHLHLADYFLYKNDTINAVKHAQTAKEIASKSENSRDLLLALKFLSDNTDSDKALGYAQRYIQINDSLYKQERDVRNKFTRIRFETDEYISKTEKLSQRVLQISLAALGVFFIFILLYIIKGQRSKQKLLKQKQKADKEIYDLTITHQRNLEKDREREKQRLSRELHDGILGRLFGVRLNLDVLNKKEDKESKQKRREYIDEIQKITQEIRLISHQLNKASFIRTDFNSLLREFVNKQPSLVELQLSLDSSVDWEKIDNAVKINIYRIIQESVNNIYKHAQATKASVRIKRADKELVLLIQDNGRGFKERKPVSGIGIKHIKKRSRSIGGKFSIHSSSKGTFLKIIISLGKNYNNPSS